MKFIFIICAIMSSFVLADIKEDFFQYGEIAVSNIGDLSYTGIITVPENKSLVIKSIRVVPIPVSDGLNIQFENTVPFECVANSGDEKRLIAFGAETVFDHDMMQINPNESLKCRLLHVYLHSPNGTMTYVHENVLYYIYGYWTTAYNTADLNKDENIDINDFILFAQNWLK
jgi:hypothetical protein